MTPLIDIPCIKPEDVTDWLDKLPLMKGAQLAVYSLLLLFGYTSTRDLAQHTRYTQATVITALHHLRASGLVDKYYQPFYKPTWNRAGRDE